MSAFLTLSLNSSWTYGSWLRCLKVFLSLPRIIDKDKSQLNFLSFALQAQLLLYYDRLYQLSTSLKTQFQTCCRCHGQNTKTLELSPHVQWTNLCFLAKHCGIRVWDADFHPKSLTLCTCSCWRSGSAPLFTAVFKKQGCESLFGVDLFEWLFVCLCFCEVTSLATLQLSINQQQNGNQSTGLLESRNTKKI